MKTSLLQCMQPIAIAVLVTALFASESRCGGPDMGGGLPREKVGGSDGGGGLPKATGTFPPPPSPSIWTHSVVLLRTQGALLDDATQQPLSDVLILVTNAVGESVTAAVTDANGEFLLLLPCIPDLELSIPSLAIAGIEIHAGDSLLILVP